MLLTDYDRASGHKISDSLISFFSNCVSKRSSIDYQFFENTIVIVLLPITLTCFM